MKFFTRLIRSFALVAGFAMLGSAAHAACTSPNAPEGSLNYNHTAHRFEYCDDSNAWKALGSGVGTMVSLTDVSITNPAGRDYLRYDAGTSKWVNISESTVMSTTTMVPNWPDAIRCNEGFVDVILYRAAESSGTNYYVEPYSSGSDYMVAFNSSGSYVSQVTRDYNNCKTSIATISAAGRAFNFIGNAATSGGALGDRITSGTLGMVANSDTSFISLSTAGTTWGYLGNAGSFLPTVTANKVSSTNISATHLQLSSPTTVLSCNAGFTGAMRYTSGTMQVCDGSNWGNIGIGVPTGTIAAFAASSCPNGWSEYTASRGRFLRGIDNGAGVDPDGTRSAGDIQSDLVGPHTHSVSMPVIMSGGSADNPGENIGGAPSIYATNGGVGYTGLNLRTTLSNGTSESRPKNVAVTFCVYSGFQSAPGQTILTKLASLTDVSVGGASTGQVLAFNGSSWVASNTTAGNANAVSSTGAVQFNVNNQLAGDTENLFWHNTNKRLGVGTATPGTTVEISSSEALRLTKTGGTADNTYLSWIKDGVRQAYMGYGIPGSYFSITMENNNSLHIGGGNVGIGTTVASTTLYVNGVIGGGFGAIGTGGVLDWNDITNARPGTGDTLLRGSTASNAPNTGDTAYFHPFSFEYSTKSGGGNLTQFAVPYSPAASLVQGMYMRGRTSGTWTGWYKFIVADPSGNAIVPNNLTAAAFLYSSDNRLKRNIQTLTGGLAKLDGLEPITFSYISDTTHRQRLGLIAQDVEKVFPQAVVTGDDGYKKVDYPSLVPVLINAVKELKAANDEQRAEGEKQLIELRTANDNLLRRIEALEARKASMR